jgi:hypothetical protein
MVQEVVVRDIDEELRCGRVRIAGSGHRDRVLGVAQTVARLVVDRILGCLLPHSRFETAALDHEAVDDPVKSVPS